MKRTISMILAILMLLPIIASYAFAVSPDDIVVTDEPQNIAHIGEFTVVSGFKNSYWDPDYLIDGDKEVGTLSPKGRSSAFKLNLGKEFYISEVVIVVNGEGELPSGAPANAENRTKSVQIKGYDEDGVLVYTSEAVDTTELSECKLEIAEDVLEIEVILNAELNSTEAYCSIWEMEAYTKTPPIRCDAEQENVASAALLNSTVYSSSEEAHVSSSWWAMDLPRMVDGDIHTGTHTVKSGAFSLWFYFGQERLMSEVVVHTNGNGALSPATGLNTAGFKDSAGQELGKDVNYFNSYQLTVVLYNFNDEVVYESELVDVSGLTEFSAQAGVNAATVELKISNAGAAGQGGSIYIWDVEIFEETGEHMYQEVDSEVPTCSIPGYRQYQCQDPSCEMRKVESIEATGYHTWDEGAVSNDSTAEANGTKVLTCVDCGATIDRDVPALGHNWDNGTVVEPYCEDGYTEYKCTDDGCALSYKDNFVTGMGHKYDEGKVTKRATTEEEGEMVFSCLREDCDYVHTKVLRKAKYIDNTFKVDNSIVVDYIGSANDELAENIFDGNFAEGFWCAPGKFTNNEDGTQTRNSGTLELILDKEYYFTKGTIYVASNWNWMEIHFMYQDENGEWQKSASYVHDRIQADQITALDMTGKMNNGAKATKIVIETVGAIGGSDTSVKTHWQIPEYQGSGLRFYEIQLEAHECELTLEDYEPKANWKMPTCSTPGSCKATCPVCEAVSTVVLDSETYAHSYGDVTVTEEPTCSNVGVGTKICSECSYKATVEIPATADHDYSKRAVFMDSDCSNTGIGQMVCEICDDVNYQYPIAPTGEHKYTYITKSQANYTAIGKDVYACQFCDLQGDKEDIITEKLEIPENFVTFKGYSIRMTGYVGIRASFQFDQEILDELENTCDVTITIYAKNVKTGKVVSAEAYGKSIYYSGTKKYNENNEFSAVAKVTDCKAEYEFSYEIKLVNFRGTEIKTVTVPGYTNGKATTNVKEIAKDALDAPSIQADVKKFLEEILAE